MLEQISIYRYNTKFANVPYSKHGIVNVTGIPYNVMDTIRNFVRGATTDKVCGIWRWEFQHIGS